MGKHSSSAEWLCSAAAELRQMGESIQPAAIERARVTFLIEGVIERGAFRSPDTSGLHAILERLRNRREMLDTELDYGLILHELMVTMEQSGYESEQDKVGPRALDLLATAIESRVDRIAGEPPIESDHDLSERAPKRVFADALSCYARDFKDDGPFAGLLYQFSTRRCQARLSQLCDKDRKRVLDAIAKWKNRKKR